MLNLIAASGMFSKIFYFLSNIFSKLFGSIEGRAIALTIIIFVCITIFVAIINRIAKFSFTRRNERRVQKLDELGELAGLNLKVIKKVLGRPDLTMPIGNGQKVYVWGTIALTFDSNNICLGYQNKAN